MITKTVRARSLRANNRLDASYFLADGNVAAERIAVAKAEGVECITLGGRNGKGKVWAPNRFTRQYAMPGEESVPYLRPYDVLSFVPEPADLISVDRTANMASYRVTPGTLLITCSGRNLGPAVVVDDFLARFMLSHDLIRIELDDAIDRFYVAAFLGTPTGQALIRRDKTGSVIDHISVSHICEIEIPLIDDGVRREAAEMMDAAVTARNDARMALDAAVREYEAALPQIAPVVTRDGWTVRSTQVGSRVDAAYYHPSVGAAAKALRASGGVTLGSVAKVEKPGGRYKTNYVAAEHGRPILSGRQLLQVRPANLQHIAMSALSAPERYVIRAGWIAFAADGRAEERLGSPVLVTTGREGWLASGHVARLIPHDLRDAGWLFAAFATRQVQEQVMALACGSVVDALYPEEMESVVLPPVDRSVGVAVLEAWEDMDRSVALERDAVSMVESALRGFG